MEYIDNRGVRVTYDPETEGHYYILVRSFPTKQTPDGKASLNLDFGAVSRNFSDVDEAIEYYAELLVRFPGFDWNNSAPIIVKARCAFDAREHGIFVQSIQTVDV